MKSEEKRKPTPKPKKGMKRSPLQIVKERFGSKAELVKNIVSLLPPEKGESKDEYTDRLNLASNDKLLRLFDAAEKLKKEFGSKEDLVKALLKLKNPASQKEDKVYLEKLLTFTQTKLLELHRQMAKKGKTKKS